MIHNELLGSPLIKKRLVEFSLRADQIGARRRHVRLTRFLLARKIVVVRHDLTNLAAGLPERRLGLLDSRALLAVLVPDLEDAPVGALVAGE